MSLLAGTSSRYPGNTKLVTFPTTGNLRDMSVVSAAPATATATATTTAAAYVEEPPLFLDDFSESEPAKAVPAGQKKSPQKRGWETVEVKDEA